MSLSKLGQFIIQYVVDNKYKILSKIVDLTTSKFNLSKEIINKIIGVVASGNVDPVMIDNLKNQVRSYAENKIREELLNQINKQLNQIGNQNIDVKSFCPSKSTLLKLINIRNTLVETLTGIKKKSSVLDSTTEPLEPVLEGLDIAAQLLLLAPIPSAVGGVGLPVGVLTTAGDTLKTIKDKIGTIKAQVSSLNKIKGYINNTVDQIVGVLQLLDILIELCAEKISKDEAAFGTETGTGVETGIDGGIGAGTGIGVGTGTGINTGNAAGTGANNLLINNLLNLQDSGLIKKLQSPTPNTDNTYKGFKLELLLDDKNDLRFPKRYAVAKTPNGVVVLRTESSFASSATVLLDELKLAIDRDNLKI